MTELGIVTEVRPVQFSNAFVPIVVNEPGMEVSPVQPLNAFEPIVVFEFDNVTEVIFVQ